MASRSEHGLNGVDLILQRIGDTAHQQSRNVFIDVGVLRAKRGYGHGHGGLQRRAGARRTSVSSSRPGALRFADWSSRQPAFPGSQTSRTSSGPAPTSCARNVTNSTSFEIFVIRFWHFRVGDPYSSRHAQDRRISHSLLLQTDLPPVSVRSSIRTEVRALWPAPSTARKAPCANGCGVSRNRTSPICAPSARSPAPAWNGWSWAAASGGAIGEGDPA